MDLINLDLYPLHKPNSDEYKNCIFKLRSEMTETGVAACPNFLKSEAVLEAVKDTESVKHKAWLTDTVRNIYLDSGNPNYSKEHIRNRHLPSMVGNFRKNYAKSFWINFRLLRLQMIICQKMEF